MDKTNRGGIRGGLWGWLGWGELWRKRQITILEQKTKQKRKNNETLSATIKMQEFCFIIHENGIYERLASLHSKGNQFKNSGKYLESSPMYNLCCR